MQRKKKRLQRLRTGIPTKQEVSQGLRYILYKGPAVKLKILFFFNKKEGNFFNPVCVYMVLPVGSLQMSILQIISIVTVYGGTVSKLHSYS